MFSFIFRGRHCTLCKLYDRDAVLVALCPCGMSSCVQLQENEIYRLNTKLAPGNLCYVHWSKLPISKGRLFTVHFLLIYKWNNKPLKSKVIICLTLNLPVHVHHVCLGFVQRSLNTHTQSKQWVRIAPGYECDQSQYWIKSLSRVCLSISLNDHWDTASFSTAGNFV